MNKLISKQSYQTDFLDKGLKLQFEFFVGQFENKRVH